MNRLEMHIAWRYLRSRRGSRLLSLISTIAIGGVIVGVSALIVIIGVMNGLQKDLREKILIGSPDVRVLTYGEDLSMANWDTILGVVRNTPGVVAAAPFVHTQAGINAGGKYSEGVFVMGIEPDQDSLEAVTSIRRTATGGDFTFRTSSGARDGVVLGSRLATRLNVQVGVDTVSLISLGDAKISPVTGLPALNIRRFEVTGIFETGMYEYDNSYVILALPAAQEVALLGGAVTGIEARTVDRWKAPGVAATLADSLGFPYRTEDWQQQNSSLFQALKLEKLGMTVILLLIVLVAAFNIVSTLTMVVTDKTREIGILKAMGMSSRSIRRIFFAQGIVIGAVGTFTGLVIGLAAAFALDRYKLIGLDASVYFIDHLPADVQLFDTLLIVLASLVIAAIATVYPARQAARLYPVEAIRHE
ncbi:MAG TPA: ABC transporter permease [Gemmatimonadaceae bacterium]|jgi:lipoprotein-releasing system permease protein|nr:ABC transporter permease [Gemmatimonadaceae bacterium]